MKIQLAVIHIFLLVLSSFTYAHADESNKEIHLSEANHPHNQMHAHEEEHEHVKRHGHDEGHEHDEEHAHENSTEINAALANKVGIITSVATAQTLRQTVTTYGSITFGPEQISHVRSRFEGLVRSVNVTIGDTVAVGDVLAEIESNSSLKIYKMRAPIPGLIIQRHANRGEATQDQILFSIASFDTLWAELRIYPLLQDKVYAGQEVSVQVNDRKAKAKIEHIIPAPDKPYQLARIKLSTEKLTLSPGLMIEAQIEVANFSVPLAVTNDAVQSLDGQPGVFVKSGNEYEFAPLKLGRSDDHFIEVLTGINKNTEYVSKNSFLIKADIEKSEAGHDH